MRNAPAPERWTIVTAEGLMMFRDDLMTREEAEAYIAVEPRTRAGKRQFAVPTSVARRLGETYRAIGARHEEAARVERELAVRVELGLDADAGLDVARATFGVRFAGRGRGYFVTRTARVEGFARTTTIAGPFTTEEAAAERAAAELVLAGGEVARHSVGVGAAIAGEPFYVVNLESSPRAILGTYLRTDEDTVLYCDALGELRHAPEDCVAVVAPDRLSATLAEKVAS